MDFIGQNQRRQSAAEKVAGGAAVLAALTGLTLPSASEAGAPEGLEPPPAASSFDCAVERAERPVEELIADLDSEDAMVRYLAVFELRQMDREESVAAFIPLLHLKVDPDAFVRREVELCLDHLGAPREDAATAHELIELLRTEREALVILGAVEGLRKIIVPVADEALLAELISLLPDLPEMQTRMQTASLMSEIAANVGTFSTARDLTLEFVREADFGVKGALVVVLGKMGPAAAVSGSVLVQTVLDHGGELSTEWPDALKQLLVELCFDTLGKLGSAAAPALLSGFQPPEDSEYLFQPVLEGLGQALGGIAYSELEGGAAYNGSVLAELLQTLDSEDTHKRIGVLNALGQMGPAADLEQFGVAASELIGQVEVHAFHDADRTTRLYGRQALAKVDPERSLELLSQHHDLRFDVNVEGLAENGLKRLMQELGYDLRLDALPQEEGTTWDYELINPQGKEQLNKLELTAVASEVERLHQSIEGAESTVRLVLNFYDFGVDGVGQEIVDRLKVLGDRGIDSEGLFAWGSEIYITIDPVGYAADKPPLDLDTILKTADDRTVSVNELQIFVYPETEESSE